MEMPCGAWTTNMTWTAARYGMFQLGDRIACGTDDYCYPGSSQNETYNFETN